MTRSVPTPPPWHPRLVAATWLTVIAAGAACWWSLLRGVRRWRRGHR